MLTPTRLRLVVLLAIFVGVMLALRQAAHAAVAAGPLAWAVLMALIFAAGLLLENRRRFAEGRPPYSLAEARELAIPAVALAGILAIAFLAG